ncbi:MAG: discoidin domain-containing protein, partial [Armatimonadetes bacterium]|nr:discoidin domain-containing protein [Armatimonadota bacterium]
MRQHDFRCAAHILAASVLLSGVLHVTVVRGGGTNRGAESLRELVESDWQLQDETRMRELREPGLVRFVETVLQWGGTVPNDSLSVPRDTTPTLNGRLEEPAWQKAAKAPATAAGEPEFRFFHDGRQVYVGVTFLSSSEGRFCGDATAADAAGAVDGVRNGLYSFHTNWELNPWWQVDLGALHSLGKVVIYNRLDYEPGLHNADQLVLSTSTDEQHWTVRHENRGKFFGGVSAGGPLVVNFSQPVQARFVRVHLPNPGG